MPIAPVVRRPLALLATAAAVAVGSAAPAAGAVAGDIRALATLPASTTTLIDDGVEPSFAPDGAAVSDDGRWAVLTTQSDDFSTADDDAANNVFLKDLQTGLLTLVSLREDEAPVPGPFGAVGVAVAGGGGNPVVLFATAVPLDPADQNASTDLYARDVAAGTTRLVSRRDGGGTALGQATDGDISDDGTIVVFATPAAAEGNDTNGMRDVHRFRRATGDLTLVSATPGVLAGNGTSTQPTVNGDGTVIAFVTTATDLVAADSDTTRDVIRATDAELTLVSRATGAGGAKANGPSDSPRITPGGSRIAFTSSATNLAAGDSSADIDVFVRAGTTDTLHASVPGPSASGGGSDVTDVSIAFVGSETLVGFASTGEFVDGAPAGPNAYLRNIVDGVTTLIAPQVGPAGFLQGNGSSLSLAADTGRAVFASADDGLTVDASPDTTPQVYARDLGSATTTLVSRLAGTAPLPPAFNTFGLAGATSVNADGRYVLVRSSSRQVSPGGVDTGPVLFRRDARTGALDPVSVDAGGTLRDAGLRASISADGRLVAFQSLAALVPADADALADVYVRDLTAGTTTLVSVATNGSSTGIRGEEAAISADGARVAFVSDSDPTAEGLTGQQVYVRDLAAGTTTLVSRGPDPVGGFDQQTSRRPSIDATGRRVSFVTSGTLGDAGGDVDSVASVYVRDLATSTTVLASRANGPAGADVDADVGDGAMISADGSRVVFTTEATNFGDNGGDRHAFVRDLAAGTTTLVDVDGTGTASLNGANDLTPSLSADGTRVAFVSSGLVDGDSPTNDSPYVRDLSTGTTTSLRRTAGVPGTPATGFVSDLALAPGGDCVALTLQAGSALVAGASPDVNHGYLRTLRGTCPEPPTVPGPGGGGGAGPPASPTPTPVPTARDTTAPRISGAKLSRTRFRAGTKRTAVSAAGKRRRTSVGTTLTVRLSEAATLRLAVQRRLPGKRSGKRCVKPTRKLRRARSCTRTPAVRTLTRKLKAGTNRIAFSGRIATRRLAPGRYRFVLRATDAAGNRSSARTVTFTVVSR